MGGPRTVELQAMCATHLRMPCRVRKDAQILSLSVWTEPGLIARAKPSTQHLKRTPSHLLEHAIPARAGGGGGVWAVSGCSWPATAPRSLQGTRHMSMRSQPPHL